MTLQEDIINELGTKPTMTRKKKFVRALNS